MNWSKKEVWSLYMFSKWIFCCSVLGFVSWWNTPVSTILLLNSYWGPCLLHNRYYLQLSKICKYEVLAKIYSFWLMLSNLFEVIMMWYSFLVLTPPKNFIAPSNQQRWVCNISIGSCFLLYKDTRKQKMDAWVDYLDSVWL